ncbi:MAG: hypothetical protein QNJ51_26260 [Calothrix sp. MO_167.B12]|nr:hypothetical protein [Calothrix sp. MO_167.B12]
MIKSPLPVPCPKHFCALTYSLFSALIEIAIALWEKQVIKNVIALWEKQVCFVLGREQRLEKLQVNNHKKPYIVSLPTSISQTNNFFNLSYVNKIVLIFVISKK